jgi:hypothetical protein
MSTDSNRLDDFPAATFAILVFCESCGRHGRLDRTKVPDGVTVQALRARRRCSGCNSRDTSIRIVYIGGGEFHYGGCTTPLTNSEVGGATGSLGATTS